MDDILASTSSPFDLNVGAGLTGTDGYGLSGALENHQLLATPLSRSRATNLTNLEIQNLLAEPTIVAIAQGSPTPSTARYPNTVTNGDFLLRGNSIATLVGDGLDEFTTWDFDLTRDPDFTSLTSTTLLASAELTLTLKPTFGIDTDGLTIQGLGSIVKPIRELAAGETRTITIDLLDYFSPDTVKQAIQTNAGRLSVTYQDDAIVSFAKLELSTFDSGIFTVGETGEVNINFLFDGGAYRGELALFSLEDMGQYKPGSEAFIEEATRRALTNSELGHIVISDRVEGARFSGALPHEGDFNAGKYSGVKAFDLRPGDRFGFMLVPNGWTSEVFEKPDIGGSKHPMFSMATSNLDSPFSIQQFIDVTGDRTTFAWEDLKLPNSDRDYNDIIFQVNGATGGAIHIDELIDPAKEWRNSRVGQELIQSVVDPLDPAGNTLDTAHRVNVSSVGRTYRGWIGTLDPADYYSFSLGASNNFSITLDGLSANANVELLDLNGNVLQSSNNPGRIAELITGTLSAGAYRLRVIPVGNIGTAYNLELAVTPLIPGITTTGSDELNGMDTAQSFDLIRLDPPLPGGIAFRTDPRFAGIDGAGWSTVIIDSGINANHPFFDRNGDGIADQVIAQQDFAEDDLTAIDTDGHGTNVSSIAASRIGVAPGANLIHLKVFPDGVDTLASEGDVEQALQWVIENAARFNIASVNLSLGSGNYDRVRTFGLSDEYQLLADLGVIVVTTTGNDFFVENSRQGVENHAADPNTIAVGAVWDGVNITDTGASGPWAFPSGAIDNTTAADRIASFSQRHATLTDIFAPGAFITGAGLQQNQFNPDGTPNPNFISGFLSNMSGTSQAAPHISGLAVLAQQLAVQTLGRRLTPGEFNQLLRATGDPINDGDDENDNVINTGLNFSRVNALNLGNAIANLQTVSVTINRVTGDFDPGDGAIEGLRRGDSDFFPRVRIAGVEEDRPTIVGDSDLIEPGWVFAQGVDSTTTTVVPITIKIFDNDRGPFNDDDRVDLNPNTGFPDVDGDDEHPNKDLNLLYNLITGEVSDSLTGQIYGRRGEQIKLEGAGDGTEGEVIFTINGWRAATPPPPPVNVVIHRVKGDFDQGPFNDSDFYAQVAIGADTFETSIIGENSDLRPNWQFSSNTADPIVPITVRILDDDQPFPPQIIDIDPQIRSTILVLSYNQVTGEIIDNATGEVYGTRGQLINLRGNDGAEIWFSVYGPPIV